MQIDGEIFRHQDGRATKRIILGGQTYFIKQHFGVGYKEIIKNLAQLRLPVLSARQEWQALTKLQTLNIKAPKVLGYGLRGKNPAKLQSFVLMEDIQEACSLETLAQQWQTEPPTYALKKYYLKRVADITRSLHASGMHHRDLYLCHFLLKNSELFLIDLHRADHAWLTKKRWQIKDLAGLYFSSLDIKLRQRDLYYFMKCYHQADLKTIFANYSALWKKALQRGDKLYLEHHCC